MHDAPLTKPSGLNRPNRTFGSYLTLITAVGLAWHVLFIQFEAPIHFLTDEFWFVTQARRLFTSVAFTNPYDGYPSALHAPLGAIVVAPLAWIWPHGDDHLRLFSALVGTTTVVVFGFVGRKFGGDRVGLLAAAIAVVTPDLWMASGLVSDDTLTALLTLSVLSVAYDGLSGWTWRRGLGFGMLIGLLVLASSESLSFAALLLIGLTVHHLRHHPPKAWLGIAAPTLLAAAICGAILTPWLAYTSSRFDGHVVLTTNLGQTLNSSNNPSTYYPGPNFGYQVPLPPVVKATPAQRNNEAEMDTIQRRDAIDYARSHLSRLVLVLPLRALWEWSLLHPSLVAQRETGLDYPSWTAYVQAVGTWILLPLGIFGIWRLRRRRFAIWPLVMMVVLGTANGMIFTPSFRYRIDGIVALVIGAAAALDWCWTRLWGSTPSLDQPPTTPDGRPTLSRHGGDRSHMSSPAGSSSSRPAFAEI